MSESKPKKYGRTVKCPHCNEQIDRNVEQFILHSKRYYHEECFGVANASAKVRYDLINYICYLHNIKVPTGYMFRQIKEFEENNGFKLPGIQLTLQYYHEVKDNPVVQGTGIGIVEYFYYEARDYFINLNKIKAHNVNIKIDNTEEVIYVKPPKNREIKTIDLEGLF